MVAGREQQPATRMLWIDIRHAMLVNVQEDVHVRNDQLRLFHRGAAEGRRAKGAQQRLDVVLIRWYRRELSYGRTLPGRAVVAS